ncbi:MAG: hypothetical protein JWR34_3924 [Mycobacterium sp.]|nr:hypothetical protein [Mycobacterium sp.]
MPPTRRINRPRGSSAEALAARLPDELRSFDAWYYNDGPGCGLKDYLSVLNTRLAGAAYPSDVMNAAGLSAADWFRHMLTRSTT